jgi:hypothetical protein
MSPWGVGLVTFVCVASGALVGILIRRIVPESHVGGDSRDAIKVVTTLIATLSAIVLGMLIAAASESFSRFDQTIRDTAVNVILLDRTLADFGPATAGERRYIKTMYQARLQELFPPPGAQRPPPDVRYEDSSLRQFIARIRALPVTNDEQAALRGRASTLLDVLAAGRWTGFVALANPVPRGLVVVLITWLVAMFVAFGLITPPNATAYGAVLIGAAAVSIAIFVMLELTSPLDGLIRISPDAMQQAYLALGQ